MEKYAVLIFNGVTVLPVFNTSNLIIAQRYIDFHAKYGVVVDAIIIDNTSGDLQDRQPIAEVK